MAEDVPVFVMLPLDTVNAKGVFQYAATPWFTKGLQFLAATGVKGVAIDVWWGAVEKSPRKYDFAAYRQVCDMLRRYDLKLQAVMSFHACGKNVNDNVHIPLPEWVQACGKQDPDIYFTSQPSGMRGGGGGRTHRNDECVSLFADHARCLAGRTPIECYRDLMAAFAASMADLLGVGIVEVVVGMGPCGELRYPAYPDIQGWRFPGVGQFQMYDRRAMASLARAADRAGRPEWGSGAPPGVGNFNDTPQSTPFFSWDGGWQTPRGHFFLSWYADALRQHADAMLAAAVTAFYPFMGPASQATVRDRQGAAVADLPTEPPPLRRNGSDIGMDQLSPMGERGAQSNSTGSLRTRHEPPGSPPDGFALSRATSGAGSRAGSGGAVDANGAVACGSAAGLAIGADGAVPGRSATATPEPDGAGSGLPPRQPALSPSNGVAHWGGAAPAAASASGDATSSAWESARWPCASDSNGALGATGPPRRLQPPPSLRSSGSAMSLQSLPLRRLPLRLSVKLAGVHWWYHTPSHAAELTAGYYNTAGRNGYSALLETCTAYAAGAVLTCVEMNDAQHPPDAACGPQALLKQVRQAANTCGLAIAGENALPCITGAGVNVQALDRIVDNTRSCHPLARRASDVAVRSLAQRSYAVPKSTSAPGSHCAAPLQGPGPLPPSISFSPPMAHYMALGGLQHSADAVMRKAPSHLDFARPAMRRSGSGDAAAATSPPRANGATHPPLSPSRSRQRLLGLSPGIPEGRSTDDGAAEVPAAPGAARAARERQSGGLPPMRMFTFLRMSSDLIQPGSKGAWMHFMCSMKSQDAAAPAYALDAPPPPN